MKKAKKFLAVVLTVMMVFTMSLPVFADTVDLNVATSADGIYAALQINQAAGSPVITTGIQGNITVNNLNDGAVLTAYKLLDITANGDGTIASVALNPAHGANVWGPLGVSSVNDLSDAYQSMPNYLSSFMNWLNVAAPTLTGGIDSSAAAGGSATFSNLDLGMYYIVQKDSGAGVYTATVPMLVTIPFKNTGVWYSDVTATAKNASAGLDKKVKAAEDTTFADTADQYTAQRLEYRVEANAPQWKAGNGQVIDVDNVKFGIVDNFTNQTYMSGSIRACAVPSGVTISNTDTFNSLSAKPGVADATTWFNFTSALTQITMDIIPASFGNMMTINADGSQSAAYEKYVFFYSTVLSTTATIGSAGNPNSVTYEYSNDLANVNDWGTLTDSTKTFTYGINIDKYYKSSGTEYLLAGAEFQLIDGTDPLWFINTAPGEYKYVTTVTTGFTYYDDATYTNMISVPTAYAKNGSGVELTTNLVTSGTTGSAKATNLNIIGLDEGTFTVKEVVAPSGYSAISDFSINLVAAVDGAGDKTGALNDITIDGTVISGASGILALSILDGTGLTLPSTGGAGIIIFTLTGMAILLGCEAAYLVRKSRRKYSEK